jgi:hypothetical protein
VCIVLLLFVPESPQWLANRGKEAQALAVIAYTHANGDRSSPTAATGFAKLQATREYEKRFSTERSYQMIFKTPLVRKRLVLALSVAVFAASTGGEIDAKRKRSRADESQVPAYQDTILVPF